MNLELLRELASVDPEVLEERASDKLLNFINEGKFAFVFFLDARELPKYLQEVNEASEKKLFWFLLDRIQARGWRWERIYVKDYGTNQEDVLVRISTLPTTNVFSTANVFWSLDQGDLTEALIRAYVNAYKEEK